MSCIGRYRRNVLNLKQTMAWSVFWCLSGVADICLETIFIRYKQEWGEKTVFWIWNMKGVLTNEGFHMLIPLALSIPIDQDSENLAAVHFYVRKPTVLVPRRPNDQDSGKAIKSPVVQQFMYIKGTAPVVKKDEKLALKHEIKPKEAKRENVASTKDFPWLDSNNKGIILSIPNLRPQKEILSILYCKVHQTKHLKDCLVLPTSKEEKVSQNSARHNMEKIGTLSETISTKSRRGQSPDFEALFSSRDEINVSTLFRRSDPQSQKLSCLDTTLPDIQGGVQSALRYSRFTYPDISFAARITKPPRMSY